MSTALATVESQSTAMARTPTVSEIAKVMFASGYFSDVRSASQAAVKIMAGQELGIPPFAAMTSIHIILGKPSLGANLLASMIRKHGYDYAVKRLDNNGCQIEFLSKLEDGKRRVLGVSSFDEEDFKTARIAGSDKPDANWKKWPRNMYFARAVSNGVRFFIPEITAGAPVYTSDELGAKVNEEGEPVAVLAPQPLDDEELPETMPPGSRGAAQEIAAQKLGAMKKAIDAEHQQAVEEISAFLTSPRATTTNYDFLKTAKELKAEIGEDAYYECLKAFGVEHANLITERDDQKRFYAALVQAHTNYKNQIHKAGGGELYGYPYRHNRHNGEERQISMAEANELYRLGNALEQPPDVVDKQVMLALEAGLHTPADCIKIYKQRLKDRDKPGPEAA